MINAGMVCHLIHFAVGITTSFQVLGDMGAHLAEEEHPSLAVPVVMEFMGG